MWRSSSPPPATVNAQAFGPQFTETLRHGCPPLGIGPRTVLEVLGHESGFDPFRQDKLLARGLWQRVPYRIREAFEEEEDSGGYIVRKGILYKLYDQTEPYKQLEDAFDFWEDKKRVFRIPSFPTRAHFLCLNIAPARLLEGKATESTVLYDKLRHPEPYQQHHALDVAKKGFIKLGDLEAPLERAAKVYQGRIWRELEALGANG